jgi:protein-S-isoprenylcysteine O-methyltransferase Ste14
MFVLVRALTYAAIFIGLVLVYLPASILSSAGITRPPTIGVAQIIGMTMVAVGVALALWCVLTFALVGKGTPAPFDPPRRLVVSGPYRVVRNPMYIGAGLALIGTALYYGSSGLWLFTAVFILIIHLFIIGYEEPTLRRTFGPDYDGYTNRVGRFWPRLRIG